MPNDFPDNLKRFLAEHVESLAQLEALLLLRGDASNWFSAEQVAKRLYLPVVMASGLLDTWQRKGFLQRENRDGNWCYRYIASTSENCGLVDELADFYRERRVAVITQIYSKPVNKVQTFADAFRLRKEE